MRQEHTVKRGQRFRDARPTLFGRVAPEWTVREAHDRLDRIEEELQQRFPNTEILIHVDPEGQTDRETLLPQEITERAT